MTIHISQLFHYPVKSLKGVALNQMEVDPFGAKWDRRFMVVEDSGRFVTQRQCPMMSQISAHMSSAGLCISFAGTDVLIDMANVLSASKTKLVKVWDDEVNAVIIEHPVNDWLSGILQRKVQLSFIGDDTHRQVDLDYAQQGDRTSFADGFPFLIVSEASIAHLSQYLPFDLAVERFRPNIVVSGCEAFAEDTWKHIIIGDIEFDIVKPCSRCVIPTIDLATGTKQPEVMQVMLAHRKQGKQVMVGQNAIHRQLGALQLGQTVKVSA